MKPFSKAAVAGMLVAACCMGSASAASFSDVTAGSELGDAVYKMADAGILTGYPDGTFQPNKGLTRAEFVQIANLTFGIQLTDSNAPTFTDVPSSYWAYDRIMAASTAGYIAGVGDNKFDPNGVLTREQVAAMVDRILKFKNLTGKEVKITDTVSPWAKASVERAIACGLFTLSEDGTFRGTQAITRAEVCQALAQYAKVPDNANNNAGGTTGGGSTGGGGGGGGSTGGNTTPSSTPANVVTALNDASQALGKISYPNGPKMTRIVTTLKTCIDDAISASNKGTTITKAYVEATYSSEIATVRSLYNELTDANKSRLQQDIINNVEKVSTVDILQNYFLK